LKKALAPELFSTPRMAPELGVVVRRAHVSRRDRPALSTQSTTPVLQVNVAPQSRQERLSQLYREDLEKMRLRARRESYCRYEVRARSPETFFASRVACARP
jgi:hypothetical protein